MSKILSQKGNITNYIYCTMLLLFFSLSSQAQNPFNNKFAFIDGVYPEIDHFKKNQPQQQYKDSIKTHYELDAEKNVLFLSAQILSLLDSLEGRKIWGLCLDQTVYIRTQELKHGRPMFIKMHVVGKLCYFYYKSFREKVVTMYVYNPHNGEKMGQRDIVNKEQVFVQQLMRLEDGQFVDFNTKNLIECMSDDPGLKKSLESLSTAEAEEKLFKTLLIYNDRNPVYIEK